jgi:hypothetical protein
MKLVEMDDDRDESADRASSDLRGTGRLLSKLKGVNSLGGEVAIHEWLGSLDSCLVRV